MAKFKRGYQMVLNFDGAGAALLMRLRELFGRGIGDTETVVSAMRVAARILDTMNTPGLELVLVDHRVPKGEQPKMTVLSVEPLPDAAKYPAMLLKSE